VYHNYKRYYISVKPISAEHYTKLLNTIPRSKLAVRTQVYCGAIIEKDKKILLVKDNKDSFRGWDFPGGRLLWNELIESCVVREALEESGYNIKVKAFLGLYQRRAEVDEEDYLRFIYIAELTEKKQGKILDPIIQEARWFDISDLRRIQIKLRSWEVLRELEDYRNGKSFPLSCVETYIW
jgi:ADP-ribose pyrophosphatase YjhB (NUDIX family)